MSVFTRKLLMLMVLVLMGSVVTSSVCANVDYSGTWNLTTQTQLPDPDTQTQLSDSNDPCIFDGTALITQDGTVLTGTASLTRTSGPGACPSDLTAEVTGSVLKNNVVLGLLLGGQLGEATFTSPAAPNMMQSANGDTGKVKADGMSLAGGFEVTKGDFMGQTGSWGAMMVAKMDDFPIPTLAFYGGLTLVLLLLVMGGFRIRRRHHPG